MVERFGCLTETTYHGGRYLAWQTCNGDYELRATFPTSQAKITPQGHQKHVSLVRLTPDTTTCIVCEGMFSALAYAQLFPREDVWYVILNSVSNWKKLVDILDTLTPAKITHLCLALDNDPAGRQTTQQLHTALQQAGLQVTCHFPPHAGDDWNDALQRGAPYEPFPIHAAPAGHGNHATNGTYANASHAQTPGCGLLRGGADAAEQGCPGCPLWDGENDHGSGADLPQWRDGVLYVAERVDQLRAMRDLLLPTRGPSRDDWPVCRPQS